MNIEELYDYCMAIPGVEATFPFDEVVKKMPKKKQQEYYGKTEG